VLPSTGEIVQIIRDSSINQKKNKPKKIKNKK